MAKRAIKSIACIGEVMIELVTSDDQQARLGVAGDTFNTAVYLHRLLGGRDESVSYVTALGTDRFSDRIVKQMMHHRLDTSFVERRDNLLPGVYAINTDENGERSFLYWRENSAARSLFQQPCNVSLDALNAFDLIYLSGITLAILPPGTRTRLIRFLDEWRKAGGTLAFDSNYRPGLWEDFDTARATISPVWAICDIALPSLDDEMALFGDRDEVAVLRRLQGSGVSFGALKRGQNGPLPIGRCDHLPSFASVENVVDTTAAGDSFNAGFLAAHMQGKPLGEALQTGHTLASKVIQTKGAIAEAALDGNEGGET